MIKRDLLNYKSLILCISFSLILLFGCSDKKNAVIEDYCDCLEKHKQLPTNEQLGACKEVLGDLVEWGDDKAIIQAKYEELDSVLKLQCPQYNEILKSFTFDNGEWRVLEEDPVTHLTEDECKAFKNYQNFYYIQTPGDTTRLKILNQLWMDNFENGMYFSYLQVSWLSSCEFQLELLETTEPQRLALFKVGDIFQYRIIDQTDRYFLMMVSFADVKQEFKLYFVD